MKYRNITLNGNKNKVFSLVKYTDEYESIINVKNNDLKNKIISYPKLKKPNNDSQSYMIVMQPNVVVGYIVITSLLSKEAKVKIEIDEKKLTKEEINELMTNLLSSLKLLLYDKDSIELDVLNNIDLDIYKEKHIGKISSNDVVSKVFNNKKTSRLMSKISKEIRDIDSSLTELNKSWTEDLELCESKDLTMFDKELLDSYKDGSATIQEKFFKADIIYWTGIFSKKFERCYTFFRDGKVILTKEAKRPVNQDSDYKITYDVMGKGFDLETREVSIIDNEKESYLENDYIDITKSKEDGMKYINYETPIIDGTSAHVELTIDSNDEIKKCYVDFRTHKSNGKINGMYLLRINNKDRICTLNFMSRDGNKNERNILGDEAYAFYGDITIDEIDDLINTCVNLINAYALRNKKQTVNLTNKRLITTYAYEEAKIIKYIDEIKGEIPYSSLSSYFFSFVEDYYRKPEKVKKMIK